MLPIYVFQCPTCAGRYEEIVAFGTEAVPCQCGGLAVKSGAENYLFSASGLESGHIAVPMKFTGKK